MRTQVHREIARLMTQMRRLCALAINKRLALVDCSMAEYAVLFRLAGTSEVPQHELAYDTALDPAAVSRLVREMSRNEMVTTRVDPTDKRQRFVRLTAKGRELERTLAPIVDAALAPLLSGLTVAEEHQFLRLLQKSHAAATLASTELEDAGEPRPRRPVRKRAS